MTDNTFSEAERAAVYRAIAERRDMRHFSGGTVEPELLRRLLEAAHQAPSVGLMQPWRFIRISDRALRGKIQHLVEDERIRTAEALGERSDEFMKLKVEGINDCAEVLVAALMDDRERHIFGRRTLTGNGHGLAVLRHPEPLAGVPRRRPGHGLGVAVRTASVGGLVGLTGRGQAFGCSLPGAGQGILSGADAGTRRLGAGASTQRIAV